jgi:hypothetical protein
MSLLPQKRLDLRVPEHSDLLVGQCPLRAIGIVAKSVVFFFLLLSLFLVLISHWAEKMGAKVLRCFGRKVRGVERT